MTSHHQYQIDRETVECLLDGTAVDHRRAPGHLVRLLAALRAAPRPVELRGEHRAMRAFQAARLAPVRRPSPRPPRRDALARLLPVRTTTAALLAVVATGGVALATVQGAVRFPAHPVPSPATTTPGDGASGGDPERFRTAPTGGPTPGPSASTPGGRPTAGPGSPTPSRPDGSPAPPAGPGAKPSVPPARPTWRPVVPAPPSVGPTGQPAVPTPPVGDGPGRPDHTGLPEPADLPPEPAGVPPGPSTANRAGAGR
ncbi:hypothetical protein [Micromonospora sp. NPDC023956]|uniref:hypothetical protein n=1 Tax=Micromonospora sp. NPDC023956 TaxID=3155722 RepID=UPI0033F76A93